MNDQECFQEFAGMAAAQVFVKQCVNYGPNRKKIKHQNCLNLGKTVTKKSQAAQHAVQHAVQDMVCALQFIVQALMFLEQAQQAVQSMLLAAQSIPCENISKQIVSELF